MPTLDEDGWQLESGVERHAEAPETFEIPDEAVRSRLVPTSAAKLIFTLRGAEGPQVERMWVQITGYTESGYLGVLTTTRAQPARPSRPVKWSSSVRTTSSMRFRPPTGTPKPASTRTSQGSSVEDTTGTLAVAASHHGQRVGDGVALNVRRWGCEPATINLEQVAIACPVGDRQPTSASGSTKSVRSSEGSAWTCSRSSGVA